MNQLWLFQPNKSWHGWDETGLSIFSGQPVRSIVREVIQNSLDAKSDDSERVRVKFELFSVQREMLPGIDTIEAILENCLEASAGESADDKAEVQEAYEYSKRRSFPILSCTDFGTKGMAGPFERGKDFYMIGGMGHSGMVSLGVSLNKKNQVICIDGDGSLLMHFGSLKAQGMFGKSNFKHILLNNASHESVGGQRTFTENLPFTKIAKLLGYKYVDIIKDNIKMKKQLKNFIKSKGPSFLEIKIKEGAIKNLGRPKNFINIKNNFKK